MLSQVIWRVLPYNKFLIHHHLPVMCEICCQFFVFQRNNVSAQWARTAIVSVSPISDFWNWRHPRLFRQACGSNTQIWIQWTTKFAQKFSSGSNSGKFLTWQGRHYGTAGMALSNSSSITLQTSGVNVSVCVRVKRLYSTQSDCRFYICTF